VQAIKRDRDQLWAEAVARFDAGERWWLADASDVRLARKEQAERYQDDPWQDAIGSYCTSRTDTAISEILASVLLLDKAKWTQSEQNRVARCLRTLGWERYRGSQEARPWRYRKPPETP
jgi:predicted P-loop ATPase